MLRELNINEMNAVAGGDEIIVTGTRVAGWDDPTSISASAAREMFDQIEMMAYINAAHGGDGLYGQMGGGSHSSPERHSYQDGQKSFDSEGNQCSTPGADYGHSWTAYNNSLGGDRSEQRMLQAAYAARDIRNESKGCSGIDGIVNPSLR